MPVGDTKTCTKCGATKPLDAFRKQKDCKDGRRADCNACCLVRAQAWRAKNADHQRAWHAARYQREKKKLLAQQRSRYLRDRERILEQQRQYTRDHREERRAAARAYAAAHREEAKARAREWYYANLSRAHAHATARRLFVASVPFIDRDAVFERDNGRCGICGDVIEGTHWHLDHILPLKHGGRHCWFNVQPAHDPCNRRKHARLMPRMLPPIEPC